MDDIKKLDEIIRLQKTISENQRELIELQEKLLVGYSKEPKTIAFRIRGLDILRDYIDDLNILNMAASSSPFKIDR